MTGLHRRICGICVGVALLGGVPAGFAQPGEGPLPAATSDTKTNDEAAMPLGQSVATKRDVPETSAGGSTAQTLLALGGVVAAALGAGAVIRRVARRVGGLRAAMGPGGRAPSGLLEVLGRFPISRGCTLVLLKLDRRVLLVSQSASRQGAGMTTLCEINDPEEVASILLKARDDEDETQARKFEAMLRGEGAAVSSAISDAGAPESRALEMIRRRAGRATAGAHA